MLFAMAGGGTGGHVVPSLAVAAELRKRGHTCLFIGTRDGMEARLVPAAGFPIEWIEIGGLKRVGWQKTLSTLSLLPGSIWQSRYILQQHAAAALFSMGGYVAGPPMLAAWLARTPMILMEANAMPGLVSRRMGRMVRKALISFPQAARYFPAGRSELTGLPVREEFFALPERPPYGPFTVLVTGGSRGSQALNRACRDSWKSFAASQSPVRFLLQCGVVEHESLTRDFAASGLAGEVTPFIQNMPEAYAQADVIVSRSGAGATSELAAAGKPSILVPFPYAADNHQHHNAAAMQHAGAAVLMPEKDLSGESLFHTLEDLRLHPEKRSAMSKAAKSLAKGGAAQRAADLLEQLATGELTPAPNATTIR